MISTAVKSEVFSFCINGNLMYVLSYHILLVVYGFVLGMDVELMVRINLICKFLFDSVVSYLRVVSYVV